MTVALVNLTVLSAFAADKGIPTGFTEGYKTIDGVRLHYVKGGKGPLILLVHGFAETWYKWRVLMPLLAATHTVVAPDVPGLGDSSPSRTDYTGQATAATIYDFTKTFARNSKFDVVAHDIGIWNTYPMIAQHPADIRSVVFMEAPIPDDSLYAAPAFSPGGESLLWHFSFFATKDDLAEHLIQGRELVFFKHFFDIHSGDHNLPDQVITYYAQAYSKPGRLHAAFGYYRDLNATIRDNAPFLATKLQMPVLAIGGGRSFGAGEGEQIRKYARNVQSQIVQGCGHWLQEECGTQTNALIMDFIRQQDH